MDKNMYGIFNGNVLELSTMPNVFNENISSKDETKVLVKVNKPNKYAKVEITIDARGKEVFDNKERLDIMKNILTDETITNIPKLNTQYMMYLDTKVTDEYEKIKQCSIINKECVLYDAVTLLPIDENDSISYVHNLVFKGGFKMDIPYDAGFGITRFKHGKESIITINDISIVGDSAPEDEATRYKYYHKPDVIKKYKDYDDKKYCVIPSGALRINDMRYLDPYLRLAPCYMRHNHNTHCVEVQRVVSERALELKEKLEKENSLNANIDESHVTVISTAEHEVNIDLSEIPTDGIRSLEFEIKVIMDCGIEVADKSTIGDILLANYDILYPPVTPDNPENPDDNTPDIGDSEILPSPGTGGSNTNPPSVDDNTTTNPDLGGDENQDNTSGDTNEPTNPDDSNPPSGDSSNPDDSTDTTNPDNNGGVSGASVDEYWW